MGYKWVSINRAGFVNRAYGLIAVITFFTVSAATAGYSQDVQGGAKVSTLPAHELLAAIDLEYRLDEENPTAPDVPLTKGSRIASDNIAKPAAESGVGARQNGWYVRPEPKVRFNRYIASIAGPIALMRYTAVAGVLTYRNAPKEWGGNWEGFGRRFLSNMGESAINNSIKYGLDEALKIDSRFYLSPKRSPAARARNAVFSAVTSRDRHGNRVFGFPKLAGHLVSNVVSAEVWYPSRYDYVHGLKGAAISIAVDGGISLIREFVLKR